MVAPSVLNRDDSGFGILFPWGSYLPRGGTSGENFAGGPPPGQHPQSKGAAHYGAVDLSNSNYNRLPKGVLLLVGVCVEEGIGGGG